jgi:hypothetical protein
MEQHAHPARPCHVLTVPPTLRAQGTLPTVADAGRIDQTQVAIRFSALFGRRQHLSRRAAQRPIGLEGKVAPRKATLLKGQGALR